MQLINDRHGVDSSGSPTLWYRMERMDWDNIVLEKRIAYTNIVVDSALDLMELYNVQNLNFVLLLDNLSPIEMIKHPRIGPAFLKSFIQRCPEHRLKNAIMVTGTTGSVFYKIAKSLAPKKLIEKITVVNSREDAANLLLDYKVFKSKDEVPTFMGGNGRDHSDEVTKSLPNMLSSVCAAMK